MAVSIVDKLMLLPGSTQDPSRERTTKEARERGEGRPISFFLSGSLSLLTNIKQVGVSGKGVRPLCQAANPAAGLWTLLK